MVAWKKLNLPLTDEILKRPASQYVATVNHQRIASKFSTQLASINPKQTVIDARSPKAYRGETSTAKRFGHIPTAINIAVHQQFENHDDANFLLTTNKLSELYADVSKDQKAAEEMVLRSGQQGVPQTDINGQMIVGFDKNRINQLLEI